MTTKSPKSGHIILLPYSSNNYAIEKVIKPTHSVWDDYAIFILLVFSILAEHQK